MKNNTLMFSSRNFTDKEVRPFLGQIQKLKYADIKYKSIVYKLICAIYVTPEKIWPGLLSLPALGWRSLHNA